MSIRDKFKKLAAQKGSRRDFVKLANREGLTDKTEPRKRLKNSLLILFNCMQKDAVNPAFHIHQIPIFRMN